MTANLFDTPIRRRKPKLRRVHKAATEAKSCPVLHDAAGEVGKDGKRAYERFWGALQALPSRDADLIKDILYLPYARVDAIRLILGRYNSADMQEQLDILSSLNI